MLFFSEKRNEAFSLLDGFQNKKMFFLLAMGCENKSEINTFWSVISEKVIQTVVIVDNNPFLVFPKDCQSVGGVDVIACSENMHSGFLVKTFKIKRKKFTKRGEEHLVSVYQYIPSKLKIKERLDFLRFVKHSYNSSKSGGPILILSSRFVKNLTLTT